MNREMNRDMNGDINGDRAEEARANGAEPGRAPAAEALAQAARAAGAKGPPPVHLWNPPYCGRLDIRIARDGLWHYLGTPIGREPLVRLFASILRREGDEYFLVTPVEKVGIAVDDAPFVAVDFRVARDGEGAPALEFETNVGDRATLGPDHPLRLERDPGTGEPTPYIMVRAGLEARIDRKTFYRMVEIGEMAARPEGRMFGVWSSGAFFALATAEELEDEGG
ncbi:MAG: DUF1285 domain-containing protein [Pseudomonadota bacterium]